MGKIAGTYARPIQGVSQQRDTERREGQVSELINMIPSPLKGLHSRYGTRHIAKLSDGITNQTAFHAYERGDGEEYIMMMNPNVGPIVYDLGGKEHSVIFKGNYSYLKSANPVKDYSFKTIGDTTFVVNNSVTVKMKDALTPKNPNIRIVYMQYATYKRTYDILINGSIVASYVAPDGTEQEHEPLVNTRYIMAELAKQMKDTKYQYSEKQVATNKGFIVFSKPILNIFHAYNHTKGESLVGGSWLTDTGQFNHGKIDVGDEIELVYTPIITGPLPVREITFIPELKGNVMFIRHKDGLPFDVTTSDGNDGKDLIAVNDRVKTVQELPPHAPNGYTVRVQRTVGYDATAYWLRAEVTGDETQWVEAVAPETQYFIDNETMPHRVISEADGSFTVTARGWENRRVGNEDTNPTPPFVGKQVNSLGILQNRLFITAGESVTFTRTNNFLDFFRETTQAEPESDPVSMFADTSQVNNLLSHAVLDGDLVFFTAQGQFLLKGNKPISLSSEFKKVTSYPMNTKALPAITGESILYSYDVDGYTGIREMYTDSLTDTKRARPVTDHIARYIKGSTTIMTASQNTNQLIVKAAEPNTLYVYNWLWAGQEKIQSAIHKWVFGGEVLYVKYFANRIILIIKYADGVFMEEMPINNEPNSEGLDFTVRLDRRREVVASKDADDVWSWNNTLGNDAVLIRSTGCYESEKGLRLYANDTIDEDIAPSGVDEVKLIIGMPYHSELTLTQPFILDRQSRVINNDRLTLGTLQLNYDSIGYIDANVFDKTTKRNWTYNFSGNKFNIGFAPLVSGSFKFPVRLPAKRAVVSFKTLDYKPLYIKDVDWQGMFKQRGGRI